MKPSTTLRRLNEARAKFVKPAQLERFQQRITVLDVCLGLGQHAAVMDTACLAKRELVGELDKRP